MGSIRHGRNRGSKLIEAAISAFRQVILAIAVASACVRAQAYVYSEDERRLWTALDERSIFPYALTDGRDGRLNSVGGIVCDDRSVFSGFIIDVSKITPKIRRPVLITTAHTFINRDGGSRGFCWYLPGGRLDERSLISGISLGITPEQKRKPADGGDWALALVNHPEPDSLPGLKVEFEDIYDFDREHEDPDDYFAISYMKKREGVMLASRCRPDDKRHYPAFAATAVDVADFSRMVIHDCDFAVGGSGGPLLKRTADGWRAIAINTGETVAHESGTLTNRNYAPPDAFNFSRRLDRDLEIELTRYLKSLE